MKKVYLIASLFVSVTAIAQKNNVGIGTTKPDQSAALEVNSTNQGFLLPRMSLQQRNAIQNPAVGLMVYQSDFISGTYQFDGKEWKNLGVSTEANSTADASNWGLLGNTGITNANFLGTDGAALNMKVGAARVGSLDAASNVYFGAGAGAATTAGGSNVGIGSSSLAAVTTQSNLIGIGQNTLKLSTGLNNIAIGGNAAAGNTTGSNNLAIGTQALFANASGDQNTAFGTFSLLNVAGAANSAFGFNSLAGGGGAAFNNNIGIGAGAGQNHTSGDLNVFIGAAAGQGNLVGSGNVFIGGLAGNTETGSNKLYIANSSTTTPLLYGDFSTKYLAVGEVAAVDRAAATSGGYRLLVKGGMITEKIKVATAGTADWADYVFDNDYKVMPLEAVEAFIKENKHLPNVPSTQEVIANGNDLGKTDAKLLEKIEELTLYMIEMNKELKNLKKENADLKKQINK